MTESNQFDWEKMSAEKRGSYLKTALPDCSFLVGSSPLDTQIIKSYKAILSSVSRVFDRMFNGDFVEARKPEEIKITDAEPDDFHNFLERIINGKNYFRLTFFEDPATTLNIFCLSRKYEVQKLEKEFKGRLLSFSYSGFPCNVLVKCFAIAKNIADEELLSRFIAVISSKAQEYPKPRWGPNIYDLDEPTFFEWFNCVYSHYTYIERFDFVEMYAKFNRLERSGVEEEFLEKMLQMVGFGYMNADTLRDGPAYSDILTNAEKKSFLKHHVVSTLYLENAVSIINK